MHAKAISVFKNSAGALLLAVASALFLINWTSSPSLVPPHDPIFFIPLSDLFFSIGGAAAVIALICFFSERITLPLVLVAWIASIFWIYQIGLIIKGHHGLTGFLGGFPYAFSVPSRGVALLADIIFGCLLVGSYMALWIARRLPLPIQLQKMSCPACGTHVQFARENLGQKTPCPHCQTTITLRKPENLKMTCFFCKEHIEFPAHAIGEKMSCPHCKMDITLKEPA